MTLPPPPHARPAPARRRRASRLAVLGALAWAAACVASGARAQNLQSLYDDARRYDATYLAALAQADSAQYRLEQVKALMRPLVTAQVTATRSEADYPVIGRTGGNNTGAQLSASQPLFNRTNTVSIEQAQKAFDIAMADMQTAEQDLIVRTAQAYFDVLAAQDSLATTRGNKAAISEQLASAKRNFEVGTATITDTREAQARYDLALAQEIAAENDLLVRRIALDQLVGRSGVEPRPFLLPVQLPPVLPGNVDNWVDQVAATPAVRRAQLAYDTAQLETRKARAGHLPTLDLVAGLGRSRDTGNSLVTPTGTTTQGQLGLQLNVPIFAGYSIQNRVRETLALEDSSRNTLDAALRNVTQGTKQAFFSVQSGEASVRALEAAEGSAKLALEATQLGYKVGVRVNLDVLNAQSQLYTTQRDLARARYDVVLGSLRLRQVAGTLKPQDVTDVNRLLEP